MNYLEYTFKGIIGDAKWEILIALLDDKGYLGFVQSDKQIIAYIPEEDKDEAALAEVLNIIQEDVHFGCAFVPEINWNEKWEQNFQAVEISEELIVRASHHEKNSKYKYDIVIDPKMSFGTGHHVTTRLMVKAMLKMNLDGLSVLDVGCGTGVLSILASMMGAKDVTAIDFDEWAYNNSVMNVKGNSRTNIEVLLGTVQLIKEKRFQLILANINRNVLLEDIKNYYLALKDQGHLVISGILDQDESVILSAAEKEGFVALQTRKEKDWLSIVLYKTDGHAETNYS